MAAIRIRRTLDSETLHLPELRPLLGRTVDIVIDDRLAADPAGQAVQMPALLDEIARTRYPLAPGTPGSTEMLREDRAR